MEEDQRLFTEEFNLVTWPENIKLGEVIGFKCYQAITTDLQIECEFISKPLGNLLFTRVKLKEEIAGGTELYGVISRCEMQDSSRDLLTYKVTINSLLSSLKNNSQVNIYCQQTPVTIIQNLISELPIQLHSDLEFMEPIQQMLQQQQTDFDLLLALCLNYALMFLIQGRQLYIFDDLRSITGKTYSLPKEKMLGHGANRAMIQSLELQQKLTRVGIQTIAVIITNTAKLQLGDCLKLFVDREIFRIIAIETELKQSNGLVYLQRQKCYLVKQQQKYYSSEIAANTPQLNMLTVQRAKTIDAKAKNYQIKLTDPSKPETMPAPHLQQLAEDIDYNLQENSLLLLGYTQNDLSKPFVLGAFADQGYQSNNQYTFINFNGSKWQIDNSGLTIATAKQELNLNSSSNILDFKAKKSSISITSGTVIDLYSQASSYSIAKQAKIMAYDFIKINIQGELLYDSRNSICLEAKDNFIGCYDFVNLSRKEILLEFKDDFNLLLNKGEAELQASELGINLEALDQVNLHTSNGNITANCQQSYFILDDANLKLSAKVIHLNAKQINLSSTAELGSN